MKKLLLIIVLCMVLGCQKEELINDRAQEDRRNATDERTDTVEVIPSLDADGWGGSIDVGFEFG